MEKLERRHESARNSENDEKSKFLWVFTKKMEKLFFVKISFCVKYLFGPYNAYFFDLEGVGQ